jgi:serpin B
MGLDERLRDAFRSGIDELGELTPPDVLRGRARVRVRRRTSFVAALLVVSLAAGVLLTQRGGPSGRRLSALRSGLVKVSPTAELVVSSVRRVAPDTTNVERLVAANSQFAFDLYHELVRESPSSNLFFSPESISDALAMIYAGARGNTAAEIGKVTHFDSLPGDELNAAFNALAQELLAPRAAEDKGHTPLQFVASNSEWGQRGYQFERAYLDTLARFYGAGLRLSDFIHDAETERQRINAYVAQQTNGRVNDLLQPGIIDNLTRLVLVNTITFTAAWRTPFTPQLTQEAPFTQIDGSRVDAQMMSQDAAGVFDGFRGNNFVAARLPYEGAASMLLIVPDAGQFTSVEQALGVSLIGRILAGLRPGADVSLPKFNFNAQVDLVNAFRELGAGDLSNFTGISPDGQLHVAHIVHDAAITVDERGTKAAAATAVIAGDLGIPGAGTLTVRADRPFIYLVRDDATGAILFVGRTLDPNQDVGGSLSR